MALNMRRRETTPFTAGIKFCKTLFYRSTQGVACRLKGSRAGALATAVPSSKEIAASPPQRSTCSGPGLWTTWSPLPEHCSSSRAGLDKLQGKNDALTTALTQKHVEASLGRSQGHEQATCVVAEHAAHAVARRVARANACLARVVKRDRSRSQFSRIRRGTEL